MCVPPAPLRFSLGVQAGFPPAQLLTPPRVGAALVGQLQEALQPFLSYSFTVLNTLTLDAPSSPKGIVSGDNYKKNILRGYR